jgi:hypothetical protein
VVEEPVELAQLPGSQAVVVRGALGQEGQSPADAVATAAVVAASRAAPKEQKTNYQSPYTRNQHKCDKKKKNRAR